jgi:hypothetical protein
VNVRLQVGRPSGALRPFVPRLWSALFLRGSSSVLERSFRSAYEPLYTAVRARKHLFGRPQRLP